MHTRCGYLATSMGKVLCCRLDLSSCTGHLCEGTYLGPQRAKGHFKDYDVGAHCVELLILRLWEGEVLLYNFCGQRVCSP